MSSLLRQNRESLLNSFRGKSSKKTPDKNDNNGTDDSPSDKRILVEKHSKQYELLYPRLQWVKARESTARKEGESYVYGSETDVQKAFQRLYVNDLCHMTHS